MSIRHARAASPGKATATMHGCRPTNGVRDGGRCTKGGHMSLLGVYGIKYVFECHVRGQLRRGRKRGLPC
jgi:hypothetical protein